MMHRSGSPRVGGISDSQHPCLTGAAFAALNQTDQLANVLSPFGRAVLRHRAASDRQLVNAGGDTAWKTSWAFCRANSMLFSTSPRSGAQIYTICGPS